MEKEREEGRTKYLFEGSIEKIKAEDSGLANMVDFEGSNQRLFVVLHSWDEERLHPEMKAMIGKKVRITVEVL